MRSSSRRARIFIGKSETLVANRAGKKSAIRTGAADSIQSRHVLDEVGKNHQCEARQHHFPEMHAFAVNKRDKSNRAEEESPIRLAAPENRTCRS